MKAQIFYIKNQEKQCDCIASMLRKYIYADIKIDSKEVTVQQLYDKEFQDSTGYLYVKYIKSSLFYTKDFRIKINVGILGMSTIMCRKIILYWRLTNLILRLYFQRSS
jgi:hypothetical protein